MSKREAYAMNIEHLRTNNANEKHSMILLYLIQQYNIWFVSCDSTHAPPKNTKHTHIHTQYTKCGATHQHRNTKYTRQAAAKAQQNTIQPEWTERIESGKESQPEKRVYSDGNIDWQTTE